MTPADIDRVFGRSRLKMVTGEHVEVFREEAQPGERRRYTKRFLCTTEGDFRHWTEREWRILARLVGHGIGPRARRREVRPRRRRQAGAGADLRRRGDCGPLGDACCRSHATVAHCAMCSRIARTGGRWRKHCLIALDAIHELRLVHLDLKADNVCVPLSPADFDPHVPGQVFRPLFGQIALIDFAFSLVAGDSLATALPIGHQADYEYQSPRLLRALEAGRLGDLLPTRQLDWRCDIFSLAAMLRRYLPQPGSGAAGAWTGRRHADAQALIDCLFRVHHGDATAQRPHRELIEIASTALREPGLAASLERGWRLADKVPIACGERPTPVTRIVLPMHALPERSGDAEGSPAFAPELAARAVDAAGIAASKGRRSEPVRSLLWVTGAVAAGVACVPLMAQAWLALQGVDASRIAAERVATQSLPMEQNGGQPSPAAANVVSAAAPPAAAPEPVPVTAPRLCPCLRLHLHLRMHLPLRMYLYLRRYPHPKPHPHLPQRPQRHHRLPPFLDPPLCERLHARVRPSPY